ncbi:hypothetical protein G7Y89_g11316 [Cudoniella acicularis]|uniref:Uncharacterized protein n=1 Tax=Cudoniella acicularis TaxID=354080 RepID=A0A8H4RDC3_9HELO|nr:hypothetical protein G7Y89_g11316 [Cudoniella acicularis]
MDYTSLFPDMVQQLLKAGLHFSTIWEVYQKCLKESLQDSRAQYVEETLCETERGVWERYWDEEKHPFPGEIKWKHTPLPSTPPPFDNRPAMPEEFDYEERNVNPRKRGREKETQMEEREARAGQRRYTSEYPKRLRSYNPNWTLITVKLATFGRVWENREGDGEESAEGSLGPVMAMPARFAAMDGTMHQSYDRALRHSRQPYDYGARAAGHSVGGYGYNDRSGRLLEHEDGAISDTVLRSVEVEAHNRGDGDGTQKFQRKEQPDDGGSPAGRRSVESAYEAEFSDGDRKPPQNRQFAEGDLSAGRGSVDEFSESSFH